MFVYYSRTQAMNRDFRGPDFFVVLDVEDDRDGNLVPLPAEAAQQQAEQEHQRAERLAARLRELGEDPETVN